MTSKSLNKFKVVRVKHKKQLDCVNCGVHVIKVSMNNTVT